MNNSRSIGRTKALQVLYAYEFQQDKTQNVSIEGLVDLSNEEFSNYLIREYLKNQELIDNLIVRQLQNWELHRINLVDRNILRLGVLEMVLKTADKAVIINEYVEIAKAWGTEKSGGFINGLLDSIVC